MGSVLGFAKTGLVLTFENRLQIHRNRLKPVLVFLVFYILYEQAPIICFWQFIVISKVQNWLVAKLASTKPSSIDTKQFLLKNRGFLGQTQVMAINLEPVF